MARIPEFQQQRLASSAVGTPGVDKSAGAGFGHLAKFADNVVDVVGKQAIAQKNALDTIKAGEVNSRFKVNTDNLLNEAKKEFELDPDGGQDLFNQRVDTAFNAELSGLKSTALQQKFASQAQTSRSNAKIAYNNFRNSQNLINAENQINQTLVNHNQRLFNAGQQGDTSALFDIIDGDIPQSVNALNEVLGPTKTQKEMKDALSGGVSAYLNGALQTQPEQVAQLLESEFIDKFLTVDEQKKFASDAKTKFKALRKVELSDQTLAMIDQNQDIWQKFIAGDLNIEEIDTAIAATGFAVEQMALRLQMAPADPESLRELKQLVDRDDFLPTLREIALADNPLDEVEVEERYAEIVDAYQKMRFKSTKRKGVFKTTADAKQLLEFQSLVARGKRDNVITKDQANTFVRQLSAPLSKELSRAKGKKTGLLGLGGEPLTAFDAVLMSIDTYTNGLNVDKESRRDIKVDILKKAFKVLDVAKIEDISQARSIAQELIREKSIELNLSLGLLPATPNAINKFDGTVENVLPGKSRAEPSRRVREKGTVIRQKSTGNWFILTEDSRKIPITEEQAQGMINNGGK